MIKRLLFTTALCILSGGVFGQTQIGNTILGEAAGDYCGDSVSISADGTIVAIGASSNNGSGPYSGHVRVYRNTSGTWTQIGSDINGEAANDYSGRSISLSADGTIVAIGAPSNDGNGVDSGHVRVYRNISNTWTQIGSDINGETVGDYSGTSVSLSSDGTIVAIGAMYNSGNGANSGQVRVYRNVSNTWVQIGLDINGEAANDHSGTAISLSADGTIVAIGATLNDGNGANSGHVSIYRNVLNTWTKIGSDINGEIAGDNSGSCVSLSPDGTIVAIGAYYNDANGTDSGHVRVYRNVSNSWTQIGADIDGEAAEDWSGISASLSADGTILAIGGHQNDGIGFSSGQVRVYRNVANTWTKIGSDIDGEAAFDFNGYSVSLSSNGAILASGAPYNGTNGFRSGHVRVYDLSSLLSTDSFVLENSKIYPNPAKNELHIELRNELELQQVNIYSILGQFIKTEKTNRINVSSLSKGVYFIEVITDKGKATQKVVVE